MWKHFLHDNGKKLKPNLPFGILSKCKSPFKPYLLTVVINVGLHLNYNSHIMHLQPGS